MKEDKNFASGFSMLEIPIALFITMVGMLGLYGMTLTLINTTSVSRNLSIASQLAQESLEEVKSVNYDGVVPDAFPPENFGSITGFADFSRTFSIVEDTPDVGSKTVLVVVSWVGDLDGSTKSTTLATILGRPGFDS